MYNKFSVCGILGKATSYDNSIVIGSRVIDSPVLGAITPQELSGWRENADIDRACAGQNFQCVDMWG